MTNLYELSKTVESVIQEVVSAEGELSPELEKRLDEIGLAFKDKNIAISKWVLNINSNADAIKAEIERLEKRAKVQDNLKKRLMDYMKFCLENAGLQKLDMGTMTLSINKNPPSVVVFDEPALPAKYVKVVQTTSIDKKQLLSDLKQGEVPGATLETEKTHLRLK